MNCSLWGGWDAGTDCQEVVDECQAGWSFEQPSSMEDVPDHGRELGTR